MDQLLQEILAKLLADRVPAWLRPFIQDILNLLLKKFLENLAVQAGLPAGAQPLSLGVHYSQEQIDRAVADTVAQLSR